MFTGIHQFRRCEELESVVGELHQRNAVGADAWAGYHKYHYAAVHKLKCAHYYFTQFDQTVNSSTPEELVNRTSELIFTVNRLLDGFFYTSGSAMDIIAREVITYLGLPHPAKVYFHTAHTEVAKHRPGDPILPRLENPPWKDEFSNYRNALTHELMVVGQFSISLALHGQSRVTVPLPDDPRLEVALRVYRRNPDAVEYVRMHFKRLVSLTNLIYGDIAERAKVAGRLPC